MSEGAEIQSKRGTCLCGSVSFEVFGEIPPGDACHCSDCRKFTGHFFASTDIPRKDLEIAGEENITWFSLNEKVRRGFCSICGSSLFWDPLERDWIAVAMGAFDSPTGAHLGKHIWVSDKGDYYEIADGLPQHQK